MDFKKAMVDAGYTNRQKRVTVTVKDVTIKFNNTIININSFDFEILKGYYVYIHYYDDVIFYVGKGIGTRCAVTNSRNNHWNNVVNKHGFNIEIIESDLEESKSFELELRLIKKYGRVDLGTGTLVNWTDGGEGLSGAVVSEATRKLFRIRSGGVNNPMYNVKVYGKDNPNYGNRGGKNPISKKIIAIDFKGNIVKYYDAIIDTKKDGYNKSSVSECCLGNRAQTGGMQFIFVKDYDSTKQYVYKKGKTSIKSVVSIQDGVIIKYYERMSYTKKDGFIPSKVSVVCNKLNSIHKGFNWMFFDELPEETQNEIMNKDIV